MNEWKRLVYVLLILSCLLFTSLNVYVYYLTIETNSNVTYLKKETKKLNDLKEENKKLLEKKNNIEKDVQKSDEENKKIESEISELEQEIKVLESKVNSLNQQNSSKTVYFTFDDGPSPRTEEILNILDKYHVKATFFITNQSDQYNYLIKRMYDEGHTIGLHTYSHNYKEIYASEDAYFNDLKAIQDKVYNITGMRPVLIRFPGGSSNTVSRFNPGIMSRLTKLVEERGFYYYDWNVDSGDAAGYNEEAQMNMIYTYSPKHDVINLLMHDSTYKYATVNSLESKIKYYLDNGYTIAPLDSSSPGMHHMVNN